MWVEHLRLKGWMSENMIAKDWLRTYISEISKKSTHIQNCLSLHFIFFSKPGF